MRKTNPDGSTSYTNRFWVYVTITCLIVSWIGWRTQRTADLVEEQATLTAECLTQVIKALQVSRAVSGENDELSITERDAFSQVLISLVRPPGELANLPYNDPRREQHILNVISEQVDVLEKVSEKEGALNQYRSEHPYPDPYCAVLNK